MRACRPPTRERGRSWLGRRSTTATSANASSPASISPVGPPPAITARSVTDIAHLPSCGFRQSAGDSAARPGSCRKPPGALYVESGKEWVPSFAA